ncbi:MAG: protein-glutamate O-methyltransferase family protein [Anaerolineaceae bacterium]|nr:protein-glutamate O-methyltransferase family protein [Anaerolineaceae bacterium]
MMKNTSLHYPDSLRAEEDGTWTHTSVVNRLPEIARRVLEENTLSKDIEARICSLIQEIPYGAIRYLQDESSLETGWNQYIQPYAGQNWLQVPWFFVEEYFYRRLLEAIGYFTDQADKEFDPFVYQKEQGLITSSGGIKKLIRQVEAWKNITSPKIMLKRLLYMNLWGNQADLSLWPVDESSLDGEKPGNLVDNQKENRILIDDTSRIAGLILAESQLKRLDLIADNAGFELLCDLLLVDYLLSNQLIGRVVIHIKSHPVFVSDVMQSDMYQTLSYLLKGSDEKVSDFGARLQTYIHTGQLEWQSHPFWVSPLPFWDMPKDLFEDLSRSNLIISKGDANYRRLLGDLHWPFEQSFEEIMAYAPAPIAAIRVFKSEIIVGLPKGLDKKMYKKDAKWLYNGSWGLIQFSETM